jgi:CRISPR system Cascade subunit CasD
MASWGDIAVGEYRRSFAHPTKSAILGMIAAAIGIQRSDNVRLEILNRSLGFSTRVDREGTLLRDYHTIQTPAANTGPHYSRRDELAVDQSRLHTILSTREFRCDAVYAICIWLLPEARITLPEIQTALREPHFVLYLGRKSCPLAVPLDPQIIKESTSVEHAVAQYSYRSDDLLKSLLQGRTTYRLYTDTIGIESNDSEHQRFIRRDQPLSRQRWQFGEREESYSMIDIQAEGE